MRDSPGVERPQCTRPGWAGALILLAGLAGCTEGRERLPLLTSGASVEPAVPATVPAAAVLRPPEHATHEPAGFVAPWKAFDASELPPANTCKPPNAFGMCGWQGQMPTLSLGREDGAPYMRILYPGRGHPMRDKVWAAPDYGGRAPSRFGLAMQLDSLRATKLYLRMVFRVSPNWTFWGATPPGFTDRAYNTGMKLFFPRVRGQTAAGEVVAPWENNVVMLAATSDDPKEPLGEGWKAGGGRREGLTHEYQMQHYAYGWSRMPRRFTCDRGRWCQLEVLLAMGDSLGQEQVWVNGEHVRTQPFITPRFLQDRTKLQKVWFSYVWAEPTFGGGLNIPWDDQWVDIRSSYISLGR